MYYRHEFNYNYPERSDEQMVRIKHVKDVNLDENYPYLDKSFFENDDISEYHQLPIKE